MPPCWLLGGRHEEGKSFISTPLEVKALGLDSRITAFRNLDLRREV